MARKVTATPDHLHAKRPGRKMTADQEKALEWVKERARPRDTKHTALPEAEGAAIGEAASPAKPAKKRR